jgi:hypothetical protein
VIGSAAGVGVVLGDRQVRAVVEKPIQDIGRFVGRRRDHARMVGIVLVGDVGVETEARIDAIASIRPSATGRRRPSSVPTLRPGDIVVMDNLGSHKVAGVRQAIEATGAERRFLPPYSPHMDPIEQVSLNSRTPSAGRPSEPPRPFGTPSASPSPTGRWRSTGQRRNQRGID